MANTSWLLVNCTSMESGCHRCVGPVPALDLPLPRGRGQAGDGMGGNGDTQCGGGAPQCAERTVTLIPFGKSLLYPETPPRTRTPPPRLDQTENAEDAGTRARAHCRHAVTRPCRVVCTGAGATDIRLAVMPAVFV